jgi:hypothetical protein
MKLYLWTKKPTSLDILYKFKFNEQHELMHTSCLSQIMDREKDVLHKFLPIHINRIFIEHKNEAYIYAKEACDLIEGKLILVYKYDQGSS